MKGLSLEMSIGKESFDAMEATYRNEGLSVGSDHMRLYGEDIQLEVSFHDLELGKRIGQGACSSVNLAQHKRTGETFAIKMFNVYDKGQASQLYNEILLLTSFQCDALISLKGAFHDEGSIGVILEYMDRGSLEFLTEAYVDVSEQVMAAISFQICWGLGYLHYEKQIHRDIKPGNMLMNSLGQVKLSDFGISKELDSTVSMSNTAVGSYRYMSPERLKGEKYDAAGDIWSVGITLIELWSKAYPFLHVADTPISLLGELDKNGIPHLLSRGGRRGYSREFADFLLYTLAMNPNDRMAAGDLMSTRWMSVSGVNNLDDSTNIVANWLRSMDRMANKSRSTGGGIDSGGSMASAGAAVGGGGTGIPPSGRQQHAQQSTARRDVNEMSLSMESSRGSSSVASGGHEDFSISREISRELSRGRMDVAPNPFTSSGSFNSSSFTGGGNSFTGGVAAHANSAQQAQQLLNAASRYRAAYDGLGAAPAEVEGEEYEEDFEEEAVERYQDQDEEIIMYDGRFDGKYSEGKYAEDNRHRGRGGEGGQGGGGGERFGQ
mmetsp:Transcript_18518/g.31006  ORF Transcript_18518/g.31006 Transcript_18518/m.31006 type:complete len:549 (-) Transcript_18518:56-1702(-)